MIFPPANTQQYVLLWASAYTRGYPSKKGREIPRSTKKPVLCEGKGPSPPILTPQLEFSGKNAAHARVDIARLYTHGAANVYLDSTRASMGRGFFPTSQFRLIFACHE